MNGIASEPVPVGAFIFGNQTLHVRFSSAIELLARLVIATPRALTVASLAEACAQSPRMVRSLLKGLSRSGLVFRHESIRDAWYCSTSPGMITLADVYRSVASTMPEAPAIRPRELADSQPDTEGCVARQSVGLLLMQATMGINQVVLQHLAAFDLARLKAVGSSSTAFSHFDTRRRSYVAEPA